MISQDTIDKVREVDLLTVISKYAAVKKRVLIISGRALFTMKSRPVFHSAR